MLSVRLAGAWSGAGACAPPRLQLSGDAGCARVWKLWTNLYAFEHQIRNMDGRRRNEVCGRRGAPGG